MTEENVVDVNYVNPPDGVESKPQRPIHKGKAPVLSKGGTSFRDNVSIIEIPIEEIASTFWSSEGLPKENSMVGFFDRGSDTMYMIYGENEKIKKNFESFVIGFGGNAEDIMKEEIKQWITTIRHDEDDISVDDLRDAVVDEYSREVKDRIKSLFEEVLDDLDDKDENPKSKSWLMERRKKFKHSTGADSTHKPPVGSRSKVWVRGYKRGGNMFEEATRVTGHYRKANPYDMKRIDDAIVTAFDVYAEEVPPPKGEDLETIVPGFLALCKSRVYVKRFGKFHNPPEDNDQPIENVEPVVEAPVENPAKYRAEVTGIGENKWSGNALEYDTEEEAKKWLDSLSLRWFGYDMGRVVPVSTPTNQPVDMEKDKIYQNFRSKHNPGNTDKLEKELRKLQRELNSSRLNTYFEGDTSEKEVARKRERASKLARLNEILKLLKEKPLPNRHYTEAQRKAIMKTPQFKDWKHEKTLTVHEEPKQGWFHAFMTDVGKSAFLKGVGRFPDIPERSDMRGADVPPKKKFYHGLPRKARANPPCCPHCKMVVLDEIKTNPPGALQCPKCKKVYMGYHEEGDK